MTVTGTIVIIAIKTEMAFTLQEDCRLYLKDHKENILAFVVSVASVAITQLCLAVEKVTIGSTYLKEHSRAPTKPGTKIGSRPDLAGRL